MAYNNAAQKGASFLLAKGATTIGGFRTHAMSIKSDIVDVTTADDTNRWRQLLAATAIKSMSATGGGVVKDTAAQQAVATDVVAQTNDTYTVTVPGLGTFSGLFTVTQFEITGDYNGEVTFTITLESAGDITFTAEG